MNVAKMSKSVRKHTKQAGFENLIEPNEASDIKNIISKWQPTPTVIREAGELFTLGSIVLVKWPSYPYWPAKITNICKNTASVTFFAICHS